MGISTSPSLWLGDKTHGTYYIRGARGIIWSLGVDINRKWVNIFNGTEFMNVINGQWAEIWSAERKKLRSGSLLMRISGNTLQIANQTGGFPDRVLASSRKTLNIFSSFAKPK
jgi:hypothetical protein